MTSCDLCEVMSIRITLEPLGSFYHLGTCSLPAHSAGEPAAQCKGTELASEQIVCAVYYATFQHQYTIIQNP